MSRSWRMMSASAAAVLLLAVGMTDSVSSRATARAAHKHAAASKHRKVRLAALNPTAIVSEPEASKPSKTVAGKCVPSKFRIVLDVGHTAESEGAISARNIAEFTYNLHLAQRIAEQLKADGFSETRLLVTGGKSKPSLFRRVAAANDLDANLFLSIHHDSVPDSFLENWEFDGRKGHFSDRFSG